MWENMFFWGLINMDSYKCCLFMFDCVWLEKRLLKDVMLLLFEIGRILLIILFFFLIDSYLLYKKIYL